MNTLSHATAPDLQVLLSSWGQLIRQAGQRALCAIGTASATLLRAGHAHCRVRTGRRGSRIVWQLLLSELAKALSAEFGKGFDASNLRHMHSFYLLFPMWDAVRRELNWTHYRSEEELRAELERERALLVQQQPSGKKIR